MKKDELIEKKVRAILDTTYGLINQLESLQNFDNAACSGTFLQIMQYMEDKNKELRLTKIDFSKYQ